MTSTAATDEFVRPARPGVILGLLATVQLMLVLDVTVVNVALPDIAASLHLPRGTVPWVMTTYTLFFGGLMLAGGRVADRFGPRRMALTGLAGFIASSALCGLSDSAASLLAGRALQGISAAVLSPAALAAVLTVFRGVRRQRAMAVWSALAGAGSALGIVLGGIVTTEASWRWIFGINVPIGVALLIAIPVLTPAGPADAAPRMPIDLLGATLMTLTTGTVIYGLISAGAYGWSSPRSWLPLAAGALLAAVFTAVEQRVAQPLLHVGLFRRRPVNAGAFLMLVATGLMVGAYFLGSFTLQHAHRASALRTGLLFLLPAVATVVGAHFASRLLSYVNARVLAVTAFMLAALGFASPALFHSTPMLVAGLTTATIGIGALFVTAFTASLGDAEPSEAGLRSAIVNTFHELGGAAGVAVLSTAAGAALVAQHVVAADFSHAYAVGSAVAVLGGALSLLLVPMVRRPVVSPGVHH